MKTRNSKQHFFAGLEEISARILSLVITCIFFAIYISARESILLSMQAGIVFLLLFWTLYEAISLVFFFVFQFFSSNQYSQQEQPLSHTPSELIKEDTNDIE